MAIIVDGKKIAADIILDVKKKVTVFRKEGINPKLVVILVGNDRASESFIRKKEESCGEAGIDFELYKFATDISSEKLLDKIKFIKEDKDIHGLVVQLPLPKKILQREILEEIDPSIDVDCLTASNLGKLTAGNYKILPPTAEAVLEILKSIKVDIKGKHIVIIGRGDLVGKPLGILLTQEKTTVTSCNKYTRNLSDYTSRADILISAVGKKGLITGDMVKEGVIAIDAGTTIQGKKIIGDVDFDTVSQMASYITPTPGGVGPINVSVLLRNLITLIEMRKGNDKK